MLKPEARAVYNFRIPEMVIWFSRVRRFARPFLLVLWFVCHAALCLSETDWAGPEQKLVQKIVAVCGPGTMALDIENRSSLNKKDFDEISNGLRTQLNARGIQIVKSEQAAINVHLSLSEDLHTYVWVAEIRQGAAESSVVMVSTPRAETRIYEHQAAPLTLRKIPLWSQSQRILDLVSLDVNGTPVHLVVLSAEELGVYHFQDGRWQQAQSLPISHARPWPRDVRGRLVLSKDHLFDVYLPGVFCQSTAHVPLS